MIGRILLYGSMLILQSIHYLYAQHALTADSRATKGTIALYQSLKLAQSQRLMILGQQDALCYGRYWRGDQDRSDVKEVTGSHPAMLGLDFHVLTHKDTEYRRLETARLVRTVKDMYKRGGIITFCWHMANPVNGGSYEWQSNPQLAVREILPGGKANGTYRSYLRRMRDFLRRCNDSGGKPIPIIFRPFHEFDGDWFWWGKGHATADEFIQLWRYTVDYLRNDLKVHQLLFAYSPDCRFQNKSDYMTHYPGDDYVDILGMDNYWDFRPDGANDPAAASLKMSIVSGIAQDRGKIAALTETGLERISDPDWFTQVLQPMLRKSPLAYFMLWRNADDIPAHYYVPTADHPAAADFKAFCRSTDIILLNTLNTIYKHDDEEKFR